MGPVDGEITADTRLRVVAELLSAEIEASHLAEGSQELTLRTLDKLVLPPLGELRVREVPVSRVDKFLKAVREHHGAGAAKNAKTVTSLLLGLAVRHGALASNPVRDTGKLPTGRKKRPRR